MHLDSKIIEKILSALRTLLLAVCTTVAVFGILIVIRNIINTAFLFNYNKGTYSVIPENILPNLAFGENYVAPYNLGNAEYHRGNYDKAIEYYLDALSQNPPEIDEECKIRVNLAFTMCHTIDFDHLDLSDQEAVQQAITVLQTARYVLTEDGCASEPVGSNDGHFTDADKLKHDIDEMLQKLQSQSDSDGDGGGGDDQDNNSGGGGEGDENNQNSERRKGKSAPARRSSRKTSRSRRKASRTEVSPRAPTTTNTSTAETPRVTEMEHYGKQKEKASFQNNNGFRCFGPHRGASGGLLGLRFGVGLRRELRG